MYIALFYLFQSCFSQLFGGQKVTKSPGTRENQSAGSLFASRKRHPSVEPALPLWPFPSVAGCCGTCFARLFNKIYTRANLQTVLTQWPATDGASALFFNGAGFSLMLLLQAVMCAVWCFLIFLLFYLLSHYVTAPLDFKQEEHCVCAFFGFCSKVLP